MTSTAGPLVLVIEDELSVRRFLRASLEGNGYRIVESTTGRDGLTQAATRSPDLVLLDLGLPDVDGIEITTRVREWSQVPIIVLSARGREQDKVSALDAGANDYLTKPFGTDELMARMRVALRARNQVAGPGSGEPVFETGELRVDLHLRVVTVAGGEVHLTPTEYNLLAVLVRNAGRVVTHRQLLRETWGPASSEQTQYLRVYMGQLRHKLEKDPARPRYLLTEPGVGYRLKSE